MLFKLTKENSAVLYPEAMKVCPEFKMLDSDELLFTILLCDYFSPYHQYPAREKLHRAKRHVYQTIDIDVDQRSHVKQAVDAYMSIQYDSRREIVKTYREKIVLVQSLIMSEEDSSRVSIHIKTIENLENAAEDLQKKIDRGDEDEIIIKGKGKLSLLEKMQKRRSIYQQKPKPIEVSILYRPVNDGSTEPG